MTWRCVQRSVICYGNERYPDSAPNTSSNHRSCSGGQPSLIVDDDGSILAGFSSGTSHEGTVAISAFRRSTDNGRTWGDAALDCYTIDVNTDPTKRSLFSSWTKLAYGTKKGRIIAVGAWGDVVNQEQYDSYCFINDGPDRTTGWTRIKLPQIETYYSIGISVCQLPNGRVLVGMYTRRLGKSGARSFCVYSDDYGNTWNLFDSSVINSDPATTGDQGVPGVIASDPNFVTEYKECYLGVLPNGNLMCLVRSDDSIQIIRKAFSSDGGSTWTGLATAFPGFNFPAWCAMSDGTIFCATRHATGTIPDGNDYAEGFTSSNNGSTWSSGIPLYDSNLGVGSAPGCGPIQLPDGRLGVVLTWCSPVNLELFTKWRLEFGIFTQTPNSPGEYARYDLDENKVHPAKYLGDAAPIGWWTTEYFRQQSVLAGAIPSRWPNMMGVEAWDLVPGTRGALIFDDGSDMTSPNGLVGGLGCMTNHAGNLSMVTEKSLTLSQPICVFLVIDAGTTASTLMVWDDTTGTTSCQFQGGNGKFFLHTNGANQFHTPVGFPPGKVLLTTLFNGASSSIRQNGTAMVVSSGGPLSGASTIAGFRLLGTGSPNGLIRSVREVVLAQISDLTKIAAYETALIAKHRILG